MLVTGKLRCSGREKPLLALHALDPEHFGKSLYEVVKARILKAARWPSCPVTCSIVYEARRTAASRAALGPVLHCLCAPTAPHTHCRGGDLI